MLGRYQSNTSLQYWKAINKGMRYLEGTKDYKFTNKHTNHLEAIGYPDLDFVE